MLLDIHTHQMPSVAGEGIRNVSPVEFRPAEGAYYSVGIHPWQASEASPADWERLEEAVRHPSVLAVGEAGLDKRTSVPLELQKEVFVRQVLLSETVCKPLVIHCVKAFNELVEMKRKYRPSVPWVVHGFRNNLHIARTLMQEGIYFSLGERYHSEVLQSLPLDRLLAETDESTRDIRTLIGRMAEMRGMSPEALCRQVDENARNIFFRR